MLVGSRALYLQVGLLILPQSSTALALIPACSLSLSNRGF